MIDHTIARIKANSEFISSLLGFEQKSKEKVPADPSGSTLSACIVDFVKRSALKALEVTNLAQRFWPMDKMPVKKDESNSQR